MTLETYLVESNLYILRVQMQITHDESYRRVMKEEHDAFAQREHLNQNLPNQQDRFHCCCVIEIDLSDDLRFQYHCILSQLQSLS